LGNRETADIVFTGTFFSGNSKALFLMLQETELAPRTCWLSQTIEEYESLTALGLPAAFWSIEHGHQHTWRMLQKSILIIGADVTFVQENIDTFEVLTSHSRKLNLWHGSPWKNIGEQLLLRHTTLQAFLVFDGFLKYSDYFLVSSSSDHTKMKAILPAAKFLHAIEPKWVSLLDDPIRPKHLDINPNLPEFSGRDLDPAKKIRRVIWAPTHRETNGVWSSDIVKGFIDKGVEVGVELVIKPHPTDVYLPKVLLGMNVEFLDPRADFYPLLQKFDFVVTDYSSLLVELKRIRYPSAAYAFDMVEYENRYGLLTDVISTEETLITDDLDLLFKEILDSEKSLSLPDELDMIKETWFKIIIRLIQ
jgi:CDP-glycerol glycerophosphotransferase